VSFPESLIEEIDAEIERLKETIPLLAEMRKLAGRLNGEAPVKDKADIPQPAKRVAHPRVVSLEKPKAEPRKRRSRKQVDTAVLRALQDNGPLSPLELNKRSVATKSTLYASLTRLMDEKLVKRLQNQTSVIYALFDHPEGESAAMKSDLERAVPPTLEGRILDAVAYRPRRIKELAKDLSAEEATVTGLIFKLTDEGEVMLGAGGVYRRV
jgi:DNA-binding MarR family transcriptional regulator